MHVVAEEGVPCGGALGADDPAVTAAPCAIVRIFPEEGIEHGADVVHHLGGDGDGIVFGIDGEEFTGSGFAE